MQRRLLRRLEQLSYQVGLQLAPTATASIFSAQYISHPRYPPHITVCKLSPSIRCIGIDMPSISMWNPRVTQGRSGR
jgi:hypothetical protein